MAKKKCLICGEKVNAKDKRCPGCGISLTKIENIKKGEFKEPVDNTDNTVNTKSLSYRTAYNLVKLDFLAKLLITILLMLLIIFAVYIIIKGEYFLLLVCIPLFLLLPFIPLPINWMQLMLENVYEINRKSK